MTKTDRALHLIEVTRKGDILQHTSGKLYRITNQEGVTTQTTISCDGQRGGSPLRLTHCFVGVVGQRDGHSFGPLRNLNLGGIVRNLSAEERGE